MRLYELPPELKRSTKNPIKQLFYKGDLSLLQMPRVAIVGARKCTNYTKGVVLNLAASLRKHGICVVSGGAVGVDHFAHTGAFPATVGVFANGLDAVYPKQNEAMIRQIYANALALSEYEGEFLPRPWHFVERNRVVVALSEAVVIAQADEQSGSMASAKFALEMGVPLYVLPQRVGESDGTNRLLARGEAKLLFDFEEFALEFGDNKTPVWLNEPKDELLAAVKSGANLDELLARFGNAVFDYELDGKVEINGVNVRIL